MLQPTVARRMLIQERQDIMSLDCVVHQIHLIAADYLKVNSVYGDAVKKVIQVSTWFTHHTVANAALQSKIFYLEKRNMALILPSSTRWCSHIDSVSRLLQGKIAIKSVCLDQQNRLLESAGQSLGSKQKTLAILEIIDDKDFWLSLEKVRSHLMPLKKASRFLEKDQTRLETVLLTLGKLYQNFDALEDPDVSELLKGNLEKIWDKMQQGLMVLAYYLNPKLNTKHLNMRQLFVQPPACAMRARAFYIQCFGADEDVAQKVVRQCAAYNHKSEGFELRDDFGSYDDPTLFWKMMVLTAPELASLALRLFQISVHTAGLERIWSVMGSIHAKNRNRLMPDKVAKVRAAAMKKANINSGLNSIDSGKQRVSRPIAAFQKQFMSPRMIFQGNVEHNFQDKAEDALLDFISKNDEIMVTEQEWDDMMNELFEDVNVENSQNVLAEEDPSAANGSKCPLQLIFTPDLPPLE